MKAIFIVLMALGFQASANDSSVPKITVKGIKPVNAQSGTVISFYGKNTDVFFDMIPAISSVMPDEDVKYAKVYRSLLLESNGWLVDISCAKADENGNPKATECSFELIKKTPDTMDYMGDSYEWAPSCKAVN